MDVENKEVTRAPLDRPLDPQENQVGTIVKVSSCPFSSSYNCNENSDVEYNEIFCIIVNAYANQVEEDCVPNIGLVLAGDKVWLDAI